MASVNEGAYATYQQHPEHISGADILGSKPKLTVALSDDLPIFHEACVFIPHLDAVFVTSNQFVAPGQSNKTIVISKLSRDVNGSWKREEIDAPGVPFANGAINYDGGIVFCAQGSLKENGGLVWMSVEPRYETKVLVEDYEGYSFNSPNDVVVHTDGSIWFTDPAYGVEQGVRPEPQLANQVYRYDPRGSLRVMADGFGKPNGICFSPDEQTVYITDTDFIRGDGNLDARRARTM